MLDQAGNPVVSAFNTLADSIDDGVLSATNLVIVSTTSGVNGG
jgi:hypothetical protein